MIGRLDVKFLTENLGRNPTIIEVGAFNGLDTKKFATVFPNGVIDSFEPVSTLYSAAHQRLIFFENVTLYPMAISNKTDLVSMHVSSGTSRASSSILNPDNVDQFFRNIKFKESDRRIVPTVTLDYWNSYRNLKRIDLLWIDAQGSEGLVIEGASQSLSLIEIIYTEVSFEEVHSGSTLFESLCAVLLEHHFELCRVWKNGPEGDALFVKQGNPLLGLWKNHFT